MKIRNIKPYLPSLIGLGLSITALIYVDEIDIFLREVANFKRRGGSVITDIGVLTFYFLAKIYYVYRSSRKSKRTRKEASLEKRKKSARIRLIVSAPAPLLFITDVILMTLTDVFADFPSDYKVVYQIAVDLMLCGIAIFISSIYDLVKLAAEEKRLERLRSCVKKYPLEDIVNLIEKLPNVNVRITDGENDISIGSKAEIDSDSGEPFYKRYYVRQDEFVSLWDFREALAPFAPDGQLSVTNSKRLADVLAGCSDVTLHRELAES